jgi:hypothetical protein
MEHSVHAGFDCLTCHADAKEIPHAEKLAPAVCNDCHPDALAQVEEYMPRRAAQYLPTHPPAATAMARMKSARELIRFLS